jgi:hypothetical protein
MVGSGTKLRYEASGGVWRNRLAKKAGLNEEEDNWIMLHSEGVREVVLVVI